MSYWGRGTQTAGEAKDTSELLTLYLFALGTAPGKSDCRTFFLLAIKGKLTFPVTISDPRDHKG